MSETTKSSGNTVLAEPIVFFGSGPVAAESLARLHQNFQIEAVITKPQPPHHKEAFPALALCEKLGLKVHTPDGKQALSELFATRPVRARLGVVIDYGFIINQDVIDYFELGIVNSHFSLLPEWRGADPITFSILSGQKQSGVSLMLITAGMDEGPLLAQAPFDIPESITTPELTEELIDISDETLKHVLPLYIAGNIQPAPQDLEHEPTYSRKLIKQDGVLDWTKPARQLEREIRAFIEWPKSRTVLGDLEVIITKAHVDHTEKLQPGVITLASESSTLLIGTSEGNLAVDRLKPAGKSEMDSKAFLAGYKNRLGM